MTDEQTTADPSPSSATIAITIHLPLDKIRETTQALLASQFTKSPYRYRDNGDGYDLIVKAVKDAIFEIDYGPIVAEAMAEMMTGGAAKEVARAVVADVVRKRIRETAKGLPANIIERAVRVALGGIESVVAKGDAITEPKGATDKP